MSAPQVVITLAVFAACGPMGLLLGMVETELRGPTRIAGLVCGLLVFACMLILFIVAGIESTPPHS